MHEFKGAIFDMDGTLLDSMPVWKRLTAGYLEQFGVHITDQEYAATEGMSQPEVAQFFIERYPSLPLNVQGLLDGMDELITARYAAIARPRAGVTAYLDGLRARGVKMAVATLTARRHAEKALRDRGMMDYFDFMLTIEDVGVSKWEPDIYLQSAARMGLTPAQCVVFEDAPYACTTAKRAGFYVCGVLEPDYAAGEGELRASSDLVIERSFDEIAGKL
nr:HAD family phosphatase [uncultured Agathobaculum sp.]